MYEKIDLQLGELQRTLLIPLWGRAKEYKIEHPILKDKFAYDIVAKINFDFDSISSRQPKQTRFTSVLRAYHIDTIIQNLMKKYSDLTVVNIGAGLDTTFQRVDNGSIFWYDLDLPDTIALRKQLIPETERNIYIAKSFLDSTWYNDILERRSKIVFISAGVFPYFRQSQVKCLFMDLIKEFPGSDIIFETMGEIMIWFGNYFRREQAQDSVFSSFLYGGISSAGIVRKWSDKIKIIDDFSVYSQVRVKEFADIKLTFQIRIMNFFKLYQVVHLTFDQ
jgi:O-methyltransferase involved in polyketide biosynthesis